MAKVKTLTMDDFSGGIDRRDGLISRDARKAYDIVNMRIDQGGKPTMRPPFELLSGSLGAKTKGFTYLNGRFYTFAYNGEDGSHTIDPSAFAYPVQTLYFDPPPLANTTWEVVDSTALNEVICVLIRHGITNGADAYVLHVFDEDFATRTLPTYVLDGACPAAWSPILPQHPFGPGKNGGPRTYAPRLAVVGGRLVISMANGDVAISAINRPRVWNQREASDFVNTGFWSYVITTDDTNLSWTIPVNPNDLRMIGGFAGYLLEYCDSDGDWRQLEQVASYPSGIGQWSIVATPSRFPGRLEPEALLRVNWGLGRGYTIRFRALPRPAVTVLSGATLLPSLQITSGVVTFEGGNTIIDSATPGTLTPSTWYYFLYGPDGLLALEDTGSATTFPDSVYSAGLYRQRVLYRAKTDGTGAVLDLSFTSGGTVEVSTGSSKVKGTSTSFTSTLRANMRVTISGETRTVRRITSDTEFEVSEPFTVAGSGLAGTYDPKFDLAFEIGDTGNEFYARKEAEAILLAGANDAGIITTSLHDPDDATVVCIVGSQNRLMVQFPQNVQLWAMADDPKTITFLSMHAIGSGENADPWPLMMDGWAMIPTSLGVRAFAPAGNNKDYIEQSPLGDKLRGITIPPLGVSAWWQKIGCYLTCAQGAGDGTIYCLSHWTNDNKIDAWSRWNVAGLTQIDGMFTAGRYLYILSGHSVYRSDPESTVFTDSVGQYEAVYRSLYNDHDNPNSNKKLVGLFYGLVGKATLSIYVNPSHTDEWVAGPPVIGPGYAQGRQKVGISAYGPAIGFEIRSSDPSGFLIEHLGYNHILCNR